MEQLLLERVGKPLVMFIITFFAVKYITGSVGDSLLIALIPLVLGAIGMLTSLGYMLTALSVIFAVVYGLMSPTAKHHVRAAFDEVGTSMEAGIDEGGKSDDAAPAKTH